MTTTLQTLDGAAIVITGGGGLLGRQHALAVAEAGGVPIIFDVDGEAASSVAADVARGSRAYQVNVTDPESIANAISQVSEHTDVTVRGLINNAALNPTVGPALGELQSASLEALVRAWRNELDVGLLGAFLCSEIIGDVIAQAGGGAILNVASDLSVISPDQRLYVDRDGVGHLKPASYSVVKTGLIGLTRWHATYFADRGVRVNALSPGGVRTDQDPAFVERLVSRIPMGRMADPDEYAGAVVFLCSDASAYMTGQNLVMDGGRSVW